MSPSSEMNNAIRSNDCNKVVEISRNCYAVLGNLIEVVSSSNKDISTCNEVTRNHDKVSAICNAFIVSNFDEFTSNLNKVSNKVSNFDKAAMQSMKNANRSDRIGGIVRFLLLTAITMNRFN